AIRQSWASRAQERARGLRIPGQACPSSAKLKPLIHMQAGLCLAPLELALNLKVWRISKPGHGKASPNGTGAHRWNSPGTPIIYAAESRALAVLEMLCHLEGRELLNPYVLSEVGIEE